MRIRIFIVIAFITFVSCEKNQDVQDISLSEYPSEIRFDNSEWLFQDKSISCLDFDADGNIWFGSGSNLIFYDEVDTQVYDAQSLINDLAVAPDGTVWLGTKDKGLVHFSEDHFTEYTKENAGIPRDYVHSVQVDSRNRVWFSSATHDLGGLMCYSNGSFTLFSPENSLLNQHVIQDIKIDKNDNVYFFTIGTVGNTSILKISDKGEWKQLGGSDALFYWLRSLDVGSNEQVYVTSDHSLSSCYACYTDEIYCFEGGRWNVLETPYNVNYIPQMFLDKRDFIWTIYSAPNEYFSIYVFDGENWFRSSEGQILETYFNKVKIDCKNNIWFCTSNGIFILKQE